MGGRALTALIYRQTRRGAMIWGSVFATFVWVSAYGYKSAYPTAKDRSSIVATLASNRGIRSIFGPARALDSVAGFTAWRCATVFALVGGVWGLLLATKVLRGDEEAGRADLFYAGPVTRSSGLGSQLLGLGVAWSVLFVTVAACFVTIGVAGDYFSASGALWFSVVSCATAAVFLGVGALTSQLASTRRAASAIAGGVLGASLLVRAIAETVDGAHWLTWTTPMGWIDKMRPLTGTDVAPLALVALATALAVGATLALGVRRDLGQGVLASRDTAEAKTALLRSPAGLALRLTRGTTIGWAAGVAVAAGVFGIVSTAVTDAFKDDQSVSDIFSRLGADISAKGYVGVTFVMMGAALGLTAAAALNACRAEESDGRLEYLTAAPLTRGRWLAARVGVAAVSLVALGLVAGLAGWAGVAVSGGSIGIGEMVVAGLNVVSPSFVVLGVGALVYGAFPRAGVGAAYAIVAWAFLVEMIGALVKLNHVLLDTSIIHHVAAAPAADPNWSAALAMVAIGALTAVAGVAALQRRDVSPG